MPNALEVLTKKWYAKAGVKDEEYSDGTLRRATGDRSHEARNLAFSRDIREAGAAILSHPSLDRRTRRIWRARLRGEDYRTIAKTQNLSFSTIVATVEKCKALMLRPEWDKHTMSEKRKSKAVEAQAVEPSPLGWPLDIPALPPEVPFVDIEGTIEMGVRNAHRKIVELTTKETLTSLDVADNERAVHTLLAVRRSEFQYFKEGLQGADPEAVRKAAIGEKP